MKRILLANLIVLGLLLAVSCSSAATTPAPRGTAPVSTGTPATQTKDWQQRWEKTLAEARREGAVSLYASPMWGADLRSALTRAFKTRYGIDLEFTPLGGAELLTKVKAEQRAGLYLADVFGVGSSSLSATLIPGGIVGPVEPMLMLPEVLDPAAWAGGDLFDYDKEDHLVICILRVVGRTLVYNKELVKEGEITSYKDLLKPQFKGQISMIDPSDSTSGGVTVPSHLIRVYGWDGGLQVLRELLIKQQAVMFKDARLQMETVARGKYAVSLGGGGAQKTEFLALGAPIAVTVPIEGDYVTASFGALGVPIKFAHRNAATVFVNWLLTKEGQSVFAKGSGLPTRRLDASLEGVDPIFIPLPGEKLGLQNRDDDLRTSKVIEAVKEIMREAGK